MKQNKFVLLVSIFSFLLIVFLVVLFTIIIPKIIKDREWEEQVREYYAKKIEMYEEENLKYGGETTTGLEERLAVSVYDLKPKVIVMLIGANNMDQMFSNYERILLGFKENLPKTKVILLSLTAMGGEHWGTKNQLAAYNNVRIKKYADKYGYYYVDLFTPLYDETTEEVYEGYTIDGGHFTKLGYDFVTGLVKPVVIQALEEYNNN